MPTDTVDNVRRIFDLCAGIGRGDVEPDLSNVGHFAQLMAQGMPAEMVAPMRKSATDLLLRGLADHFVYIGAVNPGLFQSLQRDAAALTDSELTGFKLGLRGWLPLMQGSPDDCVDLLVGRLRDNPADWRRRDMLAAILTDRALTALADIARLGESVADYELMGFEIPGTGAAVPRFLTDRYAIKIDSEENRQGRLYHDKMQIGLPLADITDGDQPAIAWHYLTLDLAKIPEASTLPFGRLHLVSPAINCDWSIACVVDDADRYRVLAVDGKVNDKPYAPIDATPASAVLIPFDDSLTYTNGHVFSTDGVHGMVGGPPIGLYPNPKCPTCSRLMLHLCTAESRIHEYGDGFRCLYACEGCRIATSTGVNWN